MRMCGRCLPRPAKYSQAADVHTSQKSLGSEQPNSGPIADLKSREPADKNRLVVAARIEVAEHGFERITAPFVEAARGGIIGTG